ncbi:ATP-dependent Lon protease [Vibrio sp. S4M6]|uniref:ATP-dependent Lon protease n=1 Tax=Vibrio sinus TaxID=2946865 RepID=UPI002029ECCF|nr:ATP-dependent Lon protease [Vibrio sinus]MCL9780326.1 ATP-dependent Lon protease [Vibrio sinus]
MIVSPANVGVPLIAPSVNVQTEQVAHDNKSREPIVPTVELVKTNAERKVKGDDKQRNRPSWDPSEHPSYEMENPPDEDASAEDEESRDHLEKLFSLLSLETYSQHQGKGYTMRFRLPKRVIDAAITEGRMACRRTVIKYHYGQAVVPNTPSDVIAVL